MPIGNLTAKQLKARLDAKESFVLVDVREPWEHQTARIEGAKLIPLNTLPEKLGELPKDQEIVFMCKMGGRSLRACQFAEQQGYRVTNLQGGILAWSAEVDPKVPQY